MDRDRVRKAEGKCKCREEGAEDIRKLLKLCYEEGRDIGGKQSTLGCL